MGEICCWLLGSSSQSNLLLLFSSRFEKQGEGGARVALWAGVKWCNRMQEDVPGFLTRYWIMIKMHFSLLFLPSGKFEAISNLLEGERVGGRQSRKTLGMLF